MVIDENNWDIAEFASTSNGITRYVGQVKNVVVNGSDYLVQFYKAVDTKAFSPDTEVIEQEQVTETLNKPIMLNCGQIMLPKVPESHKIV